MAYNSKAIKTDVNAKPIPQYFNPVTDEYEVLQGTDGAARQVLYGPDGNPISTADGKLAVKASELEALLTALKGKDFATETKLEAVRVLLNTLAGEDFATSAKQAELEAKLEAVRVLLNSLAGEDFATQTTLAQILGKMIAAPATEAKQDSLATLVGAIEDKLDGVIDGTTPATTKSTGSTMEIYKATVAERPAANSVPVGAVFMAVNTGEIWQSNGTDWVVMI